MNGISHADSVLFTSVSRLYFFGHPEYCILMAGLKYQESAPNVIRGMPLDCRTVLRLENNYLSQLPSKVKRKS